jgi:hypothetical protein
MSNNPYDPKEAARIAGVSLWRHRKATQCLERAMPACPACNRSVHRRTGLNPAIQVYFWMPLHTMQCSTVRGVPRTP